MVYGLPSHWKNAFDKFSILQHDIPQMVARSNTLPVSRGTGPSPVTFASHNEDEPLAMMEQAMASRNAQSAVAVFSEDACPCSIGRLRAYPKNRIICSIAPDGNDPIALEVAYRLARTELCWQLRHDSRGIDQAGVAEAVEIASERLEQFKGLKQNMTRLINTARSIRD